ncbi:MAG TPA: S8 family serine peptidase [Thermoanaerobaculia bacterium]
MVVALWFCSATAIAILAEPPSKVPPAPSAGGNDYYYFAGERVPLQRSQTEVVVRAKNERAPHVVTGGRGFRVVSAGSDEAVRQLRASPSVDVVAHVFEDPRTGLRLLATDEVLVKLRPGGTKKELADIAAGLGLTIDRPLRGTSDEFVLRLGDGRNGDALEKARLLHETGVFAWAEPSFIRQYGKFALPNDPRFPQQWHLDNSGQGGGRANADVDAVTAWNLTTGHANIVIAIVDDGVQKTHEDLAENIFTNPGEIAANGIDDDHNGYIDDVHGWDFSDDDNDADPSSAEDNHGTAAAGVAAARGNNATGGSGACQSCSILPVKIFSASVYAGDAATAEALRYAAGLADILNGGWGSGTPSAALQSAIQTAALTGRGGRGAVMFFASGNAASGLREHVVPELPAGTHSFRWTYRKDDSVRAGDDTAWFAWMLFPGNVLVNFENGIPSGWTMIPTYTWRWVRDPRHSDEGRCLAHAILPPALTDGQSSTLQFVKTVAAGPFITSLWVSSEAGYDGVVLEIDYGNDGSVDYTSPLLSGVPKTNAGISYPAKYPETFAVGASSNHDCRAAYSQGGGELDFIAPSSGGSRLTLGVETTDRKGADGFDPGDYTVGAGASAFGGTSASTALASGVAGLILAREPGIAPGAVRQVMRGWADKVGLDPYYSAGRNDFYGYGRLNAYRSVLAARPCAMITVSPPTLPNGETGVAYHHTLTTTGGDAPRIVSVTVGSLPPGLTLSHEGVLSGTPTAAGTFTFSVTASNWGECSGYRTYHMVIADGASPAGRSLYIVTPCRAIDSRGAANGPALPDLGTRDLQLTGVCGIPSTATAVVAILTAVAPTAKGTLSLYPTGSQWLGTSTLSYRTGKTRANNAIVRLSNQGQTTLLNKGATVHFVIDVTGYFE